MAEPSDQPLGIGGSDEAGHRLAQLIDAVVQLRPQALLLEGAVSALGAAVVSGSPTKAASSAIPSQPVEPRKWAERYCGPQSWRNAIPRATSEARPPKRSMTRRKPAAGRQSHPRPWPGAPRPRRCSGPRKQTPTPSHQPGSSHGGVGAPAPVGCLGDGRAVVGPRPAPASDPLRASSPSWPGSRSTRLPLTRTPYWRRRRARILR